MEFQSVDPRAKLQGRGLTRYIEHPFERGPRHLWNHVSQPPVQNTIVVWKDGDVSEGVDFGPEVFGSPDVHFIVQGGHDYRCDDLDVFTLSALMAAGYECRDDTIDLYAPDNKHSDEYPQVPTVSAEQARLEALRVARLARIAELEAELAALRGFTP